MQRFAHWSTLDPKCFPSVRPIPVLLAVRAAGLPGRIPVLEVMHFPTTRKAHLFTQQKNGHLLPFRRASWGHGPVASLSLVAGVATPSKTIWTTSALHLQGEFRVMLVLMMRL